jgi:hypothetical protein
MVAARPVGEGSELGGAQLRRQDDSREEVRVLGAGAGVLGVGMGELRLGVGARKQGERERRNGDGANASARVR